MLVRFLFQSKKYPLHEEYKSVFGPEIEKTVVIQILDENSGDSSSFLGCPGNFVGCSYD